MLPILHNFKCKSFSTLIICHHHLDYQEYVTQFYHSYSVAVGSSGANKGSGEDGVSQVLYHFANTSDQDHSHLEQSKHNK